MSVRLTFISVFLAFSLALINQTKDQRFSDRGIMLKTVDYRLDLNIDYENEKIFSDCQLTVLNPSGQPINQIPLILYRLMKVKSVKDEKGANLSFTQQIVAYEDWEKLQVNHIEVFLKNPLQQREKKTIKIQYEGYLLGYSEVGMKYVKDRVDKKFTIIRPDCWAYPRVGYPSWKVNRAAGFQSFDYLLIVTVPDSFVVANGGKLVRKIHKNGLVTYSYQNIKPAWRIDIVISKYGILEDKSSKLKIFYFQEDKEGAQMVLEAMQRTMELYSNWFGPLKDYQGFSIIEIPDGWGSQADVTCIIQTAAAFKDEKHLRQLYHEISHLWNAPDNDPFPCRWNEGLASFIEFLVQERFENKKGSLKKAVEWCSENFRKTCEEHPEYKEVPLVNYGKEGITGLSYSKGMVLFYILYTLVGEEQFNEIIGTYYQAYGKTGATVDNFVNHAKKVTQKDISKFLEEWFYGTQSSEYLMKKISVQEIINKYK